MGKGMLFTGHQNASEYRSHRSSWHWVTMFENFSNYFWSFLWLASPWVLERFIHALASSLGRWDKVMWSGPAVTAGMGCGGKRWLKKGGACRDCRWGAGAVAGRGAGRAGAPLPRAAGRGRCGRCRPGIAAARIRGGKLKFSKTTRN